MPRYFFHIADGDDAFIDNEGTEFPNLDAGRDEAVRTSAEMLRDGEVGPALWNGTPWRLWVTDHPSEAGPRLFTI